MQIVSKLLSLYLKLLALFQAFGGLVHVTEILGFGEVKYGQQPFACQVGHIYFGVLDITSVIGLWLGKPWGVAIWLWLVANQLVMYIGFPKIFSNQPGLIVHHLVTVFIYILLLGLNKWIAIRL